MRVARQHLEFLGLAALEPLQAKNLSGGQQKLLELGRALMLDPEILFLDEPFAGVNPFLRNEIIELVQRLHAQGRTFVIVDHDIQALQRLVLRMVVMRFRGNRALARARIERAFEQFPILYERRRQAAGTLSGGQQRQLEIARALLTDPTVMLIDEPTASIEPRVAAQIYTLIQELARANKAILLVDQNIIGALGIADYVYVMRTGTLFTEGPAHSPTM